MAKLGTLGGIVFSVSNKKVQTFDELNIDSSAKFHKHDRHLKKPLLEFGGMENDTMSFSIYFSVFLGVKPLKEMKKIDSYMKAGKVIKLILDGKKYGTNWVITKHSKGLRKFDKKGGLLIAESKITLEEYTER